MGTTVVLEEPKRYILATKDTSVIILWVQSVIAAVFTILLALDMETVRKVVKLPIWSCAFFSNITVNVTFIRTYRINRE